MTHSLKKSIEWVTAQETTTRNLTGLVSLVGGLVSELFGDRMGLLVAGV